MKTQNIKSIRISLYAAFALALVAALAVNSFAQDPKGGEKQLQLSNPSFGRVVNTAADLEGVAAGDQMVMSCPKCKNVTVTTVRTPSKGTAKEITTSSTHLCPGCTTAFETIGHGKAKTDKIVHKCTKCGSEDAFCCVMKKDAQPTTGMVK